MSNETTVPAFLVKATYHLHPDDVAAYQLIAIRATQEAREHPGCLFFNATENLADPTLFHLIEA